MATKRRKPARKTAAPAKRRRVASKTRAVARRVSRRVSSRYTKSGKVDIKNVALDAAATIAGAVAAGMAGQALAKNGVDSKISGLIPAAAGIVLALKGKGALLRAVGVGMVVTAGINVVNNLTKGVAGLSGDDGLDAIDLYRNPDLLGIPVAPDMLGIPVAPEMMGAEAHVTPWKTACAL